MRISVTCPDTARGFSLIELIVALVLMGLVGGLAMPNLTRLYDRVQYNAQLESFVQDINGLGLAANQMTKGFTLYSKDGRISGAGDLLQPLPEDWRIQIENPITYFSNGACSGGELLVFSGDTELISAVLIAPACRIQHD